MESENRQLLFDTMTKISQSLQLLEVARRNLKCLPDDISTISVGYNTASAIQSLNDLHQELIIKIETI